MADVDFDTYMRSDLGCLVYRELGDGRYLCVQRLIFHYALKLGRIGNRAFYDDGWCYYRLTDALRDFRAFQGDGDPPGSWHKHPGTGRWKVDGVIYPDVLAAERASGKGVGGAS